MYFNFDLRNTKECSKCLFRLCGTSTVDMYIVFLVCNQSGDVVDNVSHPRRLDPTMELITYSFVLYLQHGRHDVKCKPSIYIIIQCVPEKLLFEVKRQSSTVENRNGPKARSPS